MDQEFVNTAARIEAGCGVAFSTGRHPGLPRSPRWGREAGRRDGRHRGGKCAHGDHAFQTGNVNDGRGYANALFATVLATSIALAKSSSGSVERTVGWNRICSTSAMPA